jgi:hypothetical protein
MATSGLSLVFRTFITYSCEFAPFPTLISLNQLRFSPRESKSWKRSVRGRTKGQHSSHEESKSWKCKTPPISPFQTSYANKFGRESRVKHLLYCGWASLINPTRTRRTKGQTQPTRYTVVVPVVSAVARDTDHAPKAASFDYRCHFPRPAYGYATATLIPTTQTRESEPCSECSAVQRQRAPAASSLCSETLNPQQQMSRSRDPSWYVLLHSTSSLHCTWAAPWCPSRSELGRLPFLDCFWVSMS